MSIPKAQSRPSKLQHCSTHSAMQASTIINFQLSSGHSYRLQVACAVSIATVDREIFAVKNFSSTTITDEN